MEVRPLEDADVVHTDRSDGSGAPAPVPETTRDAAKTAVVTLAVIAVLFAMREAQAVVVPSLMALFLAILAEAPVAWLERKGINRVAGIVIVVTGLVLALLAVGILVGSSLQELSEQVPDYRKKVRRLFIALVAELTELGGTELAPETAEVLDPISPDAALGLATAMLTGVRDLFGSAFLIMFLMIFMLFEVPVMRAKLGTLERTRGARFSIPEIVRGYLVIKTLTSLATGLLVGVFLTLVGIDFAVLWGLLAFLLNYIPNIGSFVAAVPAVLLTLLQNGAGLAMLVAAGYLVINLTIGSGIEPRILGTGLGLSTVVVFLSLILWGWLLGPVGMLLAVPLTTSVKIVLESQAGTRDLALLLGSGRPMPGLRRQRLQAPE